MNKKKPTDRISFDSAVGALVKAARLKYRMTQKELADILGVSGQLIVKYENGGCSIPLYTLAIISDILGVKIIKLIPAKES